MRINIAFYLPNKSLGDIDYNYVTKYNPGIGGTEYLFVLNAVALSQYDDLTVTLYLEENIGSFPNTIKVFGVGGLKNAIKQAEVDCIDIFVAKHNPEWINNGCFECLPNNIHFIIWNHIVLGKKELDYYYNNKSIESVICVGREHLDLYLDHPLYRKMDYIYNGLPIPDKEELLKKLLPLEERENIVTYISSIMPFKGFHWLAKAWPKVIKAVPDAKLMVIGSGRLYDKNLTLGRYGITESEYECEFMQYLTDNEGNIHSSVHFLGKMGEDKNEILIKTKVGIPNPMGFNETFCISAVDMQIYGCSITSIASPAYLDTIVDKRNLARHASDLANYIIRELKNPSHSDYSSIYNVLNARFNFLNVAEEWHEFFINIMDGRCKVHETSNIPNIWKNFKWWRFFVYKVSKYFPLLSRALTKWQYSRYVRKIKNIIEQYEYKRI